MLVWGFMLGLIWNEISEKYLLSKKKKNSFKIYSAEQNVCSSSRILNSLKPSG